MSASYLQITSKPFQSRDSKPLLKVLTIFAPGECSDFSKSKTLNLES